MGNRALRGLSRRQSSRSPVRRCAFLVALAALIGLGSVAIPRATRSGAGLLAQSTAESAEDQPAEKSSAEAKPAVTPLDPATRRLAAEVERRFLRLSAFLGTLLVQHEDQEESGRLDVALRRARELKVTPRLEKIRELLDAGAVRDALEEEVLAEKDMRRLLRILRGEDELEALRDEKERLAALEEQLQRLERVREEQEEQLEATEPEAENPNESSDSDGGEERESPEPEEEDAGLDRKLAERQRDLERRTENLRRELERRERREEREREDPSPQNESQSGDRQEQDPSQSGERQQQNASQSGERQQQNASQSGERQQQNPSQSGERQQRASRSRNSRQQAKESLRQAERKMNDAAQRLEAGNREGAREDQSEALEQLKRAEEALSEERDQREEEAREELARKIAGRLYALLAEQELVSADTRDVESRRPPAEIAEEAAGSESEVPASSDVEAQDVEAEDVAAQIATLTDAEYAQETRSLARRERALGTDAEDILRFLEEGEASVVAPEVLRRVHDDLDNIAGLLEAGRTGALVDTLQEDVETALRELIEILQPPKKNSPRRPRASSGLATPPGESPPPGAGGESPQKEDLLKPAQEIRILVNAQRRLRERTRRAAELGILPEGSAEDGSSEQGSATDGSAEARAFAEAQTKRIAEGQARLAELTDKLIEKYPVIDQYLLGVEDGSPEDESSEEAADEPPVDDESEGAAEAPPEESAGDAEEAPEEDSAAGDDSFSNELNPDDPSGEESAGRE